MCHFLQCSVRTAYRYRYRSPTSIVDIPSSLRLSQSRCFDTFQISWAANLYMFFGESRMETMVDGYREFLRKCFCYLNNSIELSNIASWFVSVKFCRNKLYKNAEFYCWQNAGSEDRAGDEICVTDSIATEWRRKWTNVERLWPSSKYLII